MTVLLFVILMDKRFAYSLYLSLISPTVERNTEPTPAPDPASALKTAMRVKVRTVATIRATLSGEWGGGGRSPILAPGDLSETVTVLHIVHSFVSIKIKV